MAEIWDGHERRQDSVAAVRSELSSVRAALYEVAEGMKTVAPRAEVQELVRREREGRNRLIAVIVIALVIIALGIFRIERIGQENREGVHLIKDCVEETGSCAKAQAAKTAAVVSQLREALAEVQAKLEAGSRCLVRQLAEHRDANERAHQVNAKAHGYPYTAPDGEVPPPPPEVLRQACDEFIPVNQGGSAAP